MIITDESFFNLKYSKTFSTFFCLDAKETIPIYFYRDQGCREISRSPLLTTISRNPFRLAENYSNFLKRIVALLINLKVHKRKMEETLSF